MLALKDFRKSELNSSKAMIISGLTLSIVAGVCLLIVMFLQIDHIWWWIFGLVVGSGIVLLASGWTDVNKAVKLVESVQDAEFAKFKGLYTDELRKLAGELIKRVSGPKPNPGYDQANKLLLHLYFGICFDVDITTINLILFGLNTKMRVDHQPNLGFDKQGRKLLGKITLDYPNSDTPNATRTAVFWY
ncbi:MAG: hypothetical protein UT58_C0013G0002 [Microgenomates group bacterium GW2011_GWC1_39_7b]|uniref:Uncharacterized protein n=3 Tax=Candidatus Woeseibacteriota TaxID=1752722 RepID=A0A0G0LKW9_9BACT|nr:MAG: hypothetical protein UT17_C0004G0020 [Candidatus Woesebacteria bacterium GW2011_GWB1_39_10]KKR26401.1 MAG: hypothetical protein UT58_C0013G0002 [Microgenomates group bacterium GW2011_GWC1_39_7b]KKR73448.1 MAG: hypothetical protein UU16_C0021G0008 [Candidatus Woesebacteria bacterium GW2011_GWA2_40_7]KKS90664.1 MAG: hypothetical protein UV66_C0001G0021 [Candidatus Woesebacteria bacterium GW2011_GWA1_43_12]